MYVLTCIPYSPSSFFCPPPNVHTYHSCSNENKYGDYVVYESQHRGVTPLDGIKAAVGKKANVHYALGCERWSNDETGFDEAIEAAKKSDVAIVVVGTWSRDQKELWAGLNATYILSPPSIHSLAR